MSVRNLMVYNIAKKMSTPLARERLVLMLPEYRDIIDGVFDTAVENGAESLLDVIEMLEITPDSILAFAFERWLK